MSAGDWLDDNQHGLWSEFERLRGLLQDATRDEHGRDVAASFSLSAASGQAEARRYMHETERPFATDAIAAAFGLSGFERDVLLLAAGCELDAELAALCGELAGDPARAYPTFGLSLAALADGHWSALAPSGPLRYWHLIELGGTGPLLSVGLRIDERVLHHLVGIEYIDGRLSPLLRPVASAGASEQTPEERCVQLAARIYAQRADASPSVQLYGGDRSGQLAVACELARLAQTELFELAAEDLPASAYERETLARLWDREAALAPRQLILTCDAEHAAGVEALAPRLRAPLIVAARQPVNLDPARWPRHEVTRPRWSPPAARRADHRLEVAGLTERIPPLATWRDLVLPPEQTALLHDIAAQVRHAFTVYETWGFAARSSRGLGITALFSGQSGTGKTMAAEVLANELGLELYRIDLSAVVSKYIGETEKNLRRVFDAAEGQAAILLFDEADALFGKRSEVKDSHDRYANIEVSYLLQRMEQYGGLAILTSNFKSALDPAFLRRIRFVVSFPFPDAGQRAEIWRRAFPAAMPRNGVDIGRLTRLGIAGGNIRNIAVNAAFLAAESEQPLGMTHLLAAARVEYAKIEKPLSEVELAARP